MAVLKLKQPSTTDSNANTTTEEPMGSKNKQPGDSNSKENVADEDKVVVDSPTSISPKKSWLRTTSKKKSSSKKQENVGRGDEGTTKERRKSVLASMEKAMTPKKGLFKKNNKKKTSSVETDSIQEVAAWKCMSDGEDDDSITDDLTTRQNCNDKNDDNTTATPSQIAKGKTFKRKKLCRQVSQKKASLTEFCLSPRKPIDDSSPRSSRKIIQNDKTTDDNEDQAYPKSPRRSPLSQKEASLTEFCLSPGKTLEPTSPIQSEKRHYEGVKILKTPRSDKGRQSTYMQFLPTSSTPTTPSTPTTSAEPAKSAAPSTPQERQLDRRHSMPETRVPSREERRRIVEGAMTKAETPTKIRRSVSVVQKTKAHENKKSNPELPVQPIQDTQETNKPKESALSKESQTKSPSRTSQSKSSSSSTVSPSGSQKRHHRRSRSKEPKDRKRHSHSHRERSRSRSQNSRIPHEKRFRSSSSRPRTDKDNARHRRRPRRSSSSVLDTKAKRATDTAKMDSSESSVQTDPPVLRRKESRKNISLRSELRQLLSANSRGNVSSNSSVKTEPAFRTTDPASLSTNNTRPSSKSNSSRLDRILSSKSLMSSSASTGSQTRTSNRKPIARIPSKASLQSALEKQAEKKHTTSDKSTAEHEASEPSRTVTRCHSETTKRAKHAERPSIMKQNSLPINVKQSNSEPAIQPNSSQLSDMKKSMAICPSNNGKFPLQAPLPPVHCISAFCNYDSPLPVSNRKSLDPNNAEEPNKKVTRRRLPATDTAKSPKRGVAKCNAMSTRMKKQSEQVIRLEMIQDSCASLHLDEIFPSDEDEQDLKISRMESKEQERKPAEKHESDDSSIDLDTLVGHMQVLQQLEKLTVTRQKLAQERKNNSNVDEVCAYPLHDRRWRAQLHLTSALEHGRMEEFRAYYQLSQDDVMSIGMHFHFCTELLEDIHWDLIFQILFPNPQLSPKHWDPLQSSTRSTKMSELIQ